MSKTNEQKFKKPKGRARRQRIVEEESLEQLEEAGYKPTKRQRTRAKMTDVHNWNEEESCHHIE